MTPRAFPFPIGVGTDICQIKRVAAILRQEITRNRWARRTFTRLEWPALVKRFEWTNLLEQRRVNSNVGEVPEEKQSDADPWLLPHLSSYSSVFEDRDESGYWSLIDDERSPLGVLARHLAGRWAAKEAAIKAHRHRQLFMHEISIVRLGSADKMTALIDPVCKRVEIVKQIAILRGLRGFVPESQGLYKGPWVVTEGLSETAHSIFKQKMHVSRRSKVFESDRQSAEISISHNGEYATAVCMAYDPPNPQAEEKYIWDDGRGLPLHEPQWGDEGWFETESFSDIQGDESWDTESLKHSLDDWTLEVDAEAVRQPLSHVLDHRSHGGFDGIPQSH